MKKIIVCCCALGILQLAHAQKKETLNFTPPVIKKNVSLKKSKIPPPPPPAPPAPPKPPKLKHVTPPPVPPAPPMPPKF